MKGKSKVEIYQLKEEFVPIGYTKSIFLFSGNLEREDAMSGMIPGNHPDPFVDYTDGFNREAYNHVHTWQTSKLSHPEILSDCWYRFQNENSPKSYRGRSLSVTDIVSIGGVLYFCKQGGWQHIQWR